MMAHEARHDVTSDAFRHRTPAAHRVGYRASRVMFVLGFGYLLLVAGVLHRADGFGAEG